MKRCNNCDDEVMSEEVANALGMMFASFLEAINDGAFDTWEDPPALIHMRSGDEYFVADGQNPVFCGTCIQRIVAQGLKA